MSEPDRIRKATKREYAALERAAKKYVGAAFVELVCSGDYEDPLHQLAMFVLDQIIARAPQADHQNFNIATGGYLNDHDPTPFDLYDAVDAIFATFPTRPTRAPPAPGDNDDIPI